MKFLTPEGFIVFLDQVTKEFSSSTKKGRRSKPIADTNQLGGLVSAQEAAAYLGLATQSLAKMRVFGTSPPFFKVGRQVLYDVTDLDAWLVVRRRKSTSDSGSSYAFLTLGVSASRGLRRRRFRLRSPGVTRVFAGPVLAIAA